MRFGILTDGKGDERSFVSKMLPFGKTGIVGRSYQYHKGFDLWQTEWKTLSMSH